MDNEWQRFESQAKNGKITWWQMDLPSGNVRFGEAKTKMLGYSHDDFIYYQDFTNILHPTKELLHVRCVTTPPLF